MPLLSALNLGSLLSSLGLITSLVKPVPIVGDVLSGVVGGVIPILNQTLSGLPNILAAVGEDPDAAASAGLCPPIASYGKSVVPLQAFAPFDASMSNVYRYRQQQTVNLGSWFVQEAWMEPTFFSCAAGNRSSELDVASGWNGDAESARFALERHWDTWIQEADFAYLQKIGINTVRLPIGYWSLGPVYTQGTPFEPYGSVYANSWPRVVRAINQAAKYGLGVLVDLHGAPGSQNDQAHAGTSNGVAGLFDSEPDMKATINILTFLAQQLIPVTNVVGIQLLNEPTNVAGLPDFYTRALKTLRQVSPAAEKFPFYIHDGFDMPRFADYIAARSDFLVLDHHQYFVFGGDPNQSSSSLSSDIQSSISQGLLAATTRSRGNLVVDEWSCALSQAALANETDPVEARKTFCQGQMETYANATAGWGFWSYRTEACSTDNDWCFASAVGRSLPSSFFSYPANYPAQPPPAVVHLQSNATPPAAGAPIFIPGILSPLSPISQALKAIQQPSTQSVLAYASPPSAGDVLAAVEANLIVPSADAEVQSPQVFAPGASAASTSSSDADAASTSSVPVDETSSSPSSSSGSTMTPLISAGGAVSISASASKRSLRSTLSSISLAAGVPGKFSARHLRARDNASSTPSPSSDDSASAAAAPKADLTPTEAATGLGYSHGFTTAKEFALVSGSRLGFTKQYIADSLAALHLTVPASQRDNYENWFLKGLADGETQVAAVIRQGGQMGMALVVVQSETA